MTDGFCVMCVRAYVCMRMCVCAYCACLFSFGVFSFVCECVCVRVFVRVCACVQSTHCLPVFKYAQFKHLPPLDLHLQEVIITREVFILALLCTCDLYTDGRTDRD